MRLADLSEFLFGVMRVIGSSIAEPHSAVLISGSGLAGYPDSGESGAKSEGTPDAEAFGAPGIVWRPLEGTQVDGKSVNAEAFYVRTGEGVQPISWRDLRWHRIFQNPKAGTIALVGYGGQWIDLDPNGTMTLRSPGGQSTVVITDSSIDMSASVINMNGAKVTGSGDVETATGVKLGTHPHPTAMGPSGPPTPG